VLCRLRRDFQKQQYKKFLRLNTPGRFQIDRLVEIRRTDVYPVITPVQAG
jgi:hypothetical protein